MNNLTELRSLGRYRDGETIPTIKLNDNDIFVYDGGLDPTYKFLTGPIADRLYEYEQLGLDPIDIKEAMDELKRWRAAYKNVSGEFDIKPPAKPDSNFVQEFMDSVTTQAQSKGMDVLVFLTSGGKVHAKFAQPEKPMKWKVEHDGYRAHPVCGNCGEETPSESYGPYCTFCGEMMHGIETVERSGDEDD